MDLTMAYLARLSLEILIIVIRSAIGNLCGYDVLSWNALISYSGLHLYTGLQNWSRGQ